MKKNCYSSENNFKIIQKLNEKPFFFLIITTSSITSFRTIFLKIINFNNNNNKYIIFGPYNNLNSSILPTPTPIFTDINGFSPLSLTILITVSLILSSIILFASLRYQWCGSCFGEQLDCFVEQKIIERPRMPSEYIKTNQ